MLGLDASVVVEVAGPTGLVRSQLCGPRMGLDPGAAEHRPARLAELRTAPTRRLQHIPHPRPRPSGSGPRAGVPHGPDNYYDDLVARFDLGPKTVAQLHELGLLYDREAGGEFVHFYTATVGEVFFEVVQRPGGYDGHGPGTRPPAGGAARKSGPVFTPEGAGREARPPG